MAGRRGEGKEGRARHERAGLGVIVIGKETQSEEFAFE